MQPSIPFNLKRWLFTLGCSALPFLGLADQPPRVLQLNVVESGKDASPIEGATFGWMSGNFAEMEILGSTDTNGHCRFELPDKISKYSNLYVQKQGYLTVLIESIPLLAKGRLVRLWKGKEIGGVVKDDSGNPIEGANVSIQTAQQFENAIPNQHVIRHNHATPTKTDPAGRWRATVVTEKVSRLHLFVKHPGVTVHRAGRREGGGFFEKEAVTAWIM